MARIRIGNIKGPKGDTGANGLNGVNGKDGAKISDITAGEAIVFDTYVITPVTVTLSDGTTQTFNIRANSGTAQKLYRHRIYVVGSTGSGNTTVYVTLYSSDDTEATDVETLGNLIGNDFHQATGISNTKPVGYIRYNQGKLWVGSWSSDLQLVNNVPFSGSVTIRDNVEPV